MQITDVKTGLSADQVKALRLEYGKNELDKPKQTSLLKNIFESLQEPMFILLIVAALIYILVGETSDAIFMVVSIAAMIGINVFQTWRTDRSIQALRQLAAPHVEVIRDGVSQQIMSVDLVPGDVIKIYEGVKIPADCLVVEGVDLKVNESLLTGEPEGVWKTKLNSKIDPDKDQIPPEHLCYAGTFAVQGSATAIVKSIGANTEYGRIGVELAKESDLTTPLQLQIGRLIKFSSAVALFLFVVVAFVTTLNLSELEVGDRIAPGILSGITVGIAMIPEEFPVVLTVFMSMGAWRLAKKKALVRKVSAVETLGAVSALCVDKTGTMTMNLMTVDNVWSPKYDKEQLSEVLSMACELQAYDPMEKAMLDYCQTNGVNQNLLKIDDQLRDYPFSNKLKMMGHAWKVNQQIVVAVKGAPESVLKLCGLSSAQLTDALGRVETYAAKGMRVIALGYTKYDEFNQLPAKITDLKLKFVGLVYLIDPPRKGIKQQIEACKSAGIKLKMITGDNGTTAVNIAKQIGIEQTGMIITGKLIDQMTDEALKTACLESNIFSRVSPHHKLRIVEALNDLGEVTAMTGDGVNDAPALKRAHIGIAMSQRGSDVAREAADIILLDDNFGTIIKTIKDGRRIYTNIKRSVSYIFAIHVPIALSALMAPLLGIEPAGLFILPMHVMLLELIIDPTCSIVLERRPAEAGLMQQPPRKIDEKMISLKSFMSSFMQGFWIFLGSFGAYYYILTNSQNVLLARTVGLAVLIFANLLLVQIINSDQAELMAMFKKLSASRFMLAVNAIILIVFLIMIYTPASQIMRLTSLSLTQLLLSVGLAMLVTLVPHFISQRSSKSHN